MVLVKLIVLGRFVVFLIVLVYVKVKVLVKKYGAGRSYDIDHSYCIC